MKTHIEILKVLFISLLIGSCADSSPNVDNHDVQSNRKAEDREIRDSYLPLVSGSYYYYEGTLEDGRKFRDKCTVDKIVNNENDTLYYFMDEDNGIFANVFGEGLYRHKKGNIMTLRSPVHEEIENLVRTSTAYENILIPSNPKIGQQYELRDRDNSWVKTASIISFEDIEVFAGKFEGCLKVNIETVWQDNGKTYYEQVWLKDGVGLIKWDRGTGRTDELIKYDIPE